MTTTYHFLSLTTMEARVLLSAAGALSGDLDAYGYSGRECAAFDRAIAKLQAEVSRREATR